jgi:iron complex transport system substrate-binding protein
LFSFTGLGENHFEEYFMIKKLVWLLLACFCVLGCAACGNKQTTTAAGAYTVTDATGHKVVMKARPMRIVSLNVSTDEILYKLVGTDRIAAFSKLADNNGISTIPKDALQKVKLRVDAHSTEALLAARPDLVLVADWRDKNLAEALRGVGVNVFVYKTPTSIKDIENTIQQIGTITGDDAKAKAMVQDMETTLTKVKEKLGTIPKEEQVKVVALSFMGAFGGKDTTFADECQYAQVRNMLLEANVGVASEVTKEAIVKMNPDLLIMPSWDFGEKRSAKEFLEQTLNDPALQSVTAIQKKNLYQMHDAYLYSTSQECVRAVEELARAAYPHKFAAAGK